MNANRGFVGFRLKAAAVGVLAAISVAGPAGAVCYENIGCDNTNFFSKNYGYLVSPTDGPNCAFLYIMRNTIYKAHGYCFSTARAISVLGNAGCHISNQSAVPLSNIERDNIATIAKAEKAKSCPP
jgi:hypothetical protein